MRALTYGLTDVGCKRDHNEDAFHVDEDLGLHIVCDGMGGALAGEVASKRCIEIVHDVVRQNAHEIQRFDATPTAEGRRALCHLLDDAIQAANTEIYAMSAKDPNQRGMGTTIVALILAGENALIAHVGDSRIYLFRRDEIHQITEDHSLVAEQVRRGLISPEEAERSPLSNVIMRAVGTREITQVDTLHLELMPGDRFLLCSDGLSGPVSAPDIGNVLETQGDPRVAAEELIQRANAGGGPDNVTAVCLFIPQDTPSQAKIPVALKVDALEQIPLFAHMTYKELMLILDVISERTYNAQEVIIQEGAVEDEFFVLLQGRAAVTKTQRPLAKLESGALFGEMCLLDDAPRSATIVAEKECHVMAIRRGDLYPLLQREPQLAVKLLWAFCQEIVGRLRDTSSELSGTQREIERFMASGLLPFATTPGIDTVPTRRGIPSPMEKQ